MFSHLSTMLAVGKGVAAITLTAAVATGAVATSGTATGVANSAPQTSPAPSNNGHDVDAFVRDCLKKVAELREIDDRSSERYAAAAKVASEACHRAMEATGLDERAFWAKYGPKPTEKPRPTTSPDFEALLRDCVAKYEALLKGDPTDELKQAAREACTKAQEASGLTPEEFAAKLQALIHRPRPTGKPNGDAEKLVRECVEKFEAFLRSENDETRRAAKAACTKALEASGLTPEEFWARFLALVHRPTGRPPVVELERLIKDCLEKYAIYQREPTDEHRRAAKEACTKAIEASGLTPDEFWKKFGPKTEPTPTAKPPTTELGALVKDCLTKYAYAASLKDAPAEVVEKAKLAASEACAKAIAASGLSAEQFWAKFGPKPTS